MESSFRGRSIFITGGAGAFGQKLIHYLKEHSPKLVTIYSRDEMKHAAAKRIFADCGSWLQFRIGDVNNIDDLSLAMTGADIVIHAAAMKHLPECEANPTASNTVNVIGTQNVVRCFLRSNAESLVFLSTDKSPYASSVYGAQKYIGEKMITEAALLPGSKKRAFCLRYSNVIDSTGAAFNLFGGMLKNGQKVTVNGSTTVRGFVTQADVIACIDTCLKTAKGGEIAVLRPQVIKISELATAMCELIGKGSVEIKETTAFAGEKDSATLIMAEERGFTKDFAEARTEAYLLDFGKRHPERVAAKLEDEGALTLEHCEVLTGKPLREYLLPVMKANAVID